MRVSSSCPPTADAVKIVDALEADIDDLVAIYCDSLEEDIITRFMFGHRRVQAVQVQTKSFVPVLRKWLTNPPSRCHIIKAVDEINGEILGWSLARWEDGISSPEPPKKTPGEPEFLRFYWLQQNKNWRKLTTDKKHVVLGSLYVKPGRQRRGIGSLLLSKLFEQDGLENELVFVQTLSSSEGFYAKFGWEMAASTDIDLREWAGENRGYGLHKSPQMLRQPGPFGRDS